MIPQWPGKFCIHLRSSNVRYFRIDEAMGLKICLRGHLQWHDLPIESHKIYVLVQKLLGEHRQTDRQQANLINLTFLLS